MASLQFIVNGIIAGSIYALVASGFSLIYSTNKFMHFAHGSSVVIGGYILFSLFTQLGIPFSVSCVLTIILTGIFGVLMNRLIYVPLQKKNSSNVILLIASIAVLLLFQNLVQMRYGAGTKTIGLLEVSEGLSLFGAHITYLQIILFVTSLVLFFMLHLLMKKTKLGRNMRAVADNKELAEIIGINSARISDYSFMIGSMLAGVAGILIGLVQNLSPTMGTDLMIKGFTGAVIGGITSVPGAIVGSFLLGIVENLGVAFLPSGYKNGIAFLLLFVFLLFRPRGLFGLDKGVKQ